MTSVKVFDPAMCCSTGVCGPGVDPELARFASDLEWLSAQGVQVERFNLAQQPEAFVGHPVVTEAMRERGGGALPLILVDGETVSAGSYASREELADWSGIAEASRPGRSERPAEPLPVMPTASEAICGCGEGGCC
jgi:hypothetical protein